jgi:predicted membrane channel-forming protein YqfA (hemolysin III family)
VPEHQAIHLLIAGIYIPFTIAALNGALGWWLFGTSWGLEVFGLVLDALSQEGFGWPLAGGICYTLGMVFCVLGHWDSLFHVIWHLFVIAGSVSHDFSILLFILGSPSNVKIDCPGDDAVNFRRPALRSPENLYTCHPFHIACIESAGIPPTSS